MDLREYRACGIDGCNNMFEPTTPDQEFCGNCSVSMMIRLHHQSILADKWYNQRWKKEGIRGDWKI